LSQRALYFSRFRGKRARGGQVPGSEQPGRLSHSYRGDNVTLIGRPLPIRDQKRLTDGVSFEGQQSAGCRKTCGKGVKRTEIILMGCSTPRLALWQGSLACRTNGHFSACPAFVCRWYLLPWPMREASVLRKVRPQCTNTTTAA